MLLLVSSLHVYRCHSYGSNPNSTTFSQILSIVCPYFINNCTRRTQSLSVIFNLANSQASSIAEGSRVRTLSEQIAI